MNGEKGILFTQGNEACVRGALYAGCLLYTSQLRPYQTPRSGVNGNAMKRKKSYFWRSKIPIFMTEGLRLAGKEGFDGNKAVDACFTAVSYTHLDVYKRQPMERSPRLRSRMPCTGCAPWLRMCVCSRTRPEPCRVWP